MVDSQNSRFKAPVSVIILTLNEEANIRNCLRSVYGWSDDIHVVDSFSQDNTVDLSTEYTANIHEVNEGHWADIRNGAIRSLPLKYEWVLFLDADERPTEGLRREISQLLRTSPEENGFYIKRRFVFMNRWLKHGGLYEKVLRLFRHEFAEYIPEGDVEYATVKGKVGLLRQDLVHEDKKGISAWIEKHNKISERAAKSYLDKERFLPLQQERGSEIEGGRRTYAKYTVWKKVPLVSRPFVMFTYQYFLKLGFLDGLEGLIYHFLQGFWYRLLIYVKVRERQMKASFNAQDL